MSFSHSGIACLLIGLVLVGAWSSPALAQVYGTLGTTASASQQIPAYGSTGLPAAYPSTSPDAAGTPSLPSTYGTAAAQGVGSPSPTTYPSTAYSTPPAMTAPPPQQMPAYGSPGITPYPSTSALSASPTMPNILPDGSVGPSSPGPLLRPNGSPDPMASFATARDANAELLMGSNEPWQWQVAPTGLMYRSYLAGNREPRLAGEVMHNRSNGWFWDATVGGRVGLLRYGTENELLPQGWQLDVEGAAFPRLNLEHNEDLDAVDFRGGLLSTTRTGPLETKFGYYHLSSHLGDEYMIRTPASLATRINYVRDSLIAGAAVYLNPSLRLYSEVGWTFHEDGGARPWEFQFGLDYSSLEPTGLYGAPFFAINAHLRQENCFGGNLSVQTGWQWRGRSGHLARVGMQYFNGMSDQYQFFNQFEENIGFGVWYDY